MQQCDNRLTALKLEQFKETCKSHQIKLTPQRLLIYEELMTTDEHPSTDMLYQRVRTIFPTISFDTVNRTLLTFHELGLAEIVEGSGNPKRFDGDTTRHHHFQCLKCKRVFDVHYAPYDALEIPPNIQKRFQVLKTNVHLQGYCEQCQEQGQED